MGGGPPREFHSVYLWLNKSHRPAKHRGHSPGEPVPIPAKPRSYVMAVSYGEKIRRTSWSTVARISLSRSRSEDETRMATVWPIPTRA